MTSQNYYDVTDWPEGDPREDIGQVINSIIRDIKKRQTDSVGGSSSGWNKKCRSRLRRVTCRPAST